MDISVFRVLEDFQNVQTRLDPGLFLMAILVSLASSFTASVLYRYFYESRGTGSQVHRSFPLLGISITTLFIGVQTSIPLSLGLLGALSIIRFRTPIKEPEELGFIMLIVAASISAATFNFSFIVVLYVVAIASLIVIRSTRALTVFKRDGLIVLTINNEDIEKKRNEIDVVLDKYIRRRTLESSSSRDGVTNIQWSIHGLKSDAVELQNQLNNICAFQSINIFLERPGGIR